MPVSDITNIEPILRKISAIGPRRVLDLGVGFGKYGVLIREIQEAVNGRCTPDTFQNILNGVEGFEKYRNPLWEMYNRIDILNFGDETHWKEFVGYDLVLAIDTLEHLPKQKAKALIQHLVSSNKGLIVSVPIGHCPQGGVFGNELETHVDDWYPKDFSEWQHSCLRQGVCYVAYIEGN